MKKLLFSIAFILSGCATVEGPSYSGDLVDVSSDKSKLIVYRIWSGTGAVHKAPFFVDQKLIAELHNSTFSIVEVDPGERIVSYGSMKDPLFRNVKINMLAGQSYCVELERGFPDDFRELPCSEAESRLKSEDSKFFPLAK